METNMYKIVIQKTHMFDDVQKNNPKYMGVFFGMHKLNA